MRQNYPEILWFHITRDGRFGKNSILFFGIMFFMLFSSLSVVGQNGVTITSTAANPTIQNPIPIEIKFDQPVNFFEQSDISLINGNLSNFFVETPNFVYDNNFARLGSFRINILGSDLSPTKDAIVAFDINSSGEIYALTFDNGIKKFSSNGVAVNNNPIIDKNEFSEPRDIALDSDGNIYVADSGNNRIVVFNSFGTRINYIGISLLNAPSGLAVNSNQEIYVADTNNDRILIFNKSGSVVGEINKGSGSGSEQLNNPIRLAVDKFDNVYINDLGNDRIQIYNSNYEHAGRIQAGSETFGAAGSILVDEYGFIYIADLGSVDLSTFLNFGDLNIADLIPLATDSNLSVKVFRSDNLSGPPTTINKNMNIPVDLAFKSCGFLAVNNGDANLDGGSVIPPRLFVKVIFDMKTYRGLPDTFTADLTMTDECIPAKISIPSSIAINLTCEDNTESNDFEMIWDKTNPVKDSCPEDQTVELANGNYSMEDFIHLANFSDNCDMDLTIKQIPDVGEIITETTTVTITAIDDAGNVSDECTFLVVIEDDVVSPTFTCPNTDAAPGLNLDANCNYDAPSYSNLITNLTNFENSAFFVQSEKRNGNSLSINIKVYDGEGGDFVGECNLVVNLIDVTPPQFTSCNLQDMNVELENGETYAVPDFVSQLNATDNCDANPVITQSIATGTPITETTIITLIATDEEGNISNNCEVSINILKKQNPTFDCPDPNQTTILELDENCTFTVPDYSNRITNFENFENEPFFIQTQVRNGNVLTLTLRVFDGSEGEEAGSCQILVNLEDQSPPAVICPNDIFVPYTGSKEYEIEDYFSLLTITDNCSDSFTYSQTPQPGVVISEDTRIEFTITDNNNNQSSCNFEVIFYEETELQILNCPTEQTFEVDSNCSYLIPDIASTITTNIDGAVVTQNITPGFRVNGSLQLIITAKFEDQLDTCEVNLIAIDSINPLIICPGEQNETITEGEGFQLPNYILTSTYSDNCFIAEFKQQPEVGTIIYESTEVLLTVIDASGNPDSCSFIVNITSSNPDIELNCPSTQFEKLDENCQFLLPDYTPLSQVNFEAEVTQNPLPGTLINKNTDIILSAKGDVGTTTCVFKVMVEDATSPVAICIESMDLMLNANGQASLNPDSVDDNSYDACGIISKTLSQSIFTSADLGENTVLFTVTDAAGNSDFCETIVKVLPYDENAPDFSCIGSLIIELDENGEAQIKPEDLYTSNGAGYEFSIDKSIFTCADMGSNDIQLTYTNGTIQGSCEVEVIVKDTSAPLVRVKDIGVALNEFGSVSITAEMLDNGSSDNCGNLSFNISKLTFGCKELGENIVTFTATDSSGNSSSTTAIVTVTGDCNINPLPGVEYIYIYPNPTSGPFQFATPSGVTIQRVEIFDFRGRMILFKDFSETDFQYSMDLSGVQNAVYVLKLFTSEGIEIKRVIIE